MLNLSADDRPIAIASLFVLVILALGSGYTLATQGSLAFLSPLYLLQQLQVGAFLGIVAAGMMVVILLGHIDLSVPWTLAAAAMMATAVGGSLAIPVGLGVGLLVGILNGLGVAYLRVPSMIFTLGVNALLRGLMVMYTGGFAPQTHSTELMSFLATGHVLGLPMALMVWALLSVAMVFLLRRTVFGRYVYAIGNREAAAYLSGVPTRAVLVAAFALCGLCSGLARRAAGRLLDQGLSGHGRRLPAALDRGRGDRRYPHPGRSGPLRRHGRRHDPDHAAFVGIVGDADARGRPPDHLRLGDHRHAAGVCPWPTRRRLSHRLLAERLRDGG